jgi:hypothetical protein
MLASCGGLLTSTGVTVDVGGAVSVTVAFCTGEGVMLTVDIPTKGAALGSFVPILVPSVGDSAIHADHSIEITTNKESNFTFFLFISSFPFLMN